MAIQQVASYAVLAYATAFVLLLTTHGISAVPDSRLRGNAHSAAPYPTTFLDMPVSKSSALGSHPSYDFQTKTYDANFQPVSVSNEEMTITPFFSPDTAASNIIDIIQSAKKSILIGTPGFTSWVGCTNWVESSCIGCAVGKQRFNETFPVFQVLVNKLIEGVSVSVMTNNYVTPTCEGYIDPLTFLTLAGADVRYFDTVTFLHAKFILVDGKRVAISSVNYSQTSFMRNREAGVILEGSDDILNFAQSVYEKDFAQAKKLVPTHSYNSTSMAIIQSKTPIPVVVPDPPSYTSCAAPTTVAKSVTEHMDVTVVASPDNALDTIMSDLQKATSLDLSIYQITDEVLCNQLISMHEDGIKMRIFVSYRIFSSPDYYRAQSCYQNMSSAGITIMQADKSCLEFYHQKYWIIDGDTVWLSTGNWSPTDYPNDPMEFPPYKGHSSTWRDTNRDFTVRMSAKEAVDQFQKVFDADYANGQEYVPKKKEETEE